MTSTVPVGWRCLACGSGLGTLWLAPQQGADVGGDTFRPSADLFGSTIGAVVRCRSCGHGSVVEGVDTTAVREAYGDAEDEVSLREEEGQIATARRDLAAIESLTPVGRVLDVGCWTGSFLVAARERGWDVAGIEPSDWAAGRARARGLTVTHAQLDDVALPVERYRLVVACDVIEHLVDPVGSVCRLAAALEPNGLLFATVPDAGSALARALGRRWWSVLPMHLQYFTRASMGHVLARAGLRPLLMRTHPKAFTVRYYAERLAAFAPPLGGLAVRALDGKSFGDRVVAPNFGDRLAVVACAAA